MLELFCWLILFCALYSAARFAVWVFGIERRYRSFPKRGIHGKGRMKMSTIKPQVWWFW